MALVDRAKNIIVSPKTEWPVIAEEQPDPARLITGYILPLSLIPAVASFIGYGLIGVTMPILGTIRGIDIGVAIAIRSILNAVIGVAVGAFVIDLLAESFKSEKNMGRSMQLVAYAYTPTLVAGIFSIVPLLGLLTLVASIYGLYVMYLGFPVIKKTPPDKVAFYMVVSLLVLIVVFVVIGAILNLILGGVGLPVM